MPNGKICYVEIPATDAAVSGAFVTGRDPHRTVDVVTYVMVDDIDATLLLVAANGGLVHAQRAELSPAGDAYALFVDIAGNVFGVYQEPRKC